MKYCLYVSPVNIKEMTQWLPQDTRRNYNYTVCHKGKSDPYFTCRYTLNKTLAKKSYSYTLLLNATMNYLLKEFDEHYKLLWLSDSLFLGKRCGDTQFCMYLLFAVPVSAEIALFCFLKAVFSVLYDVVMIRK